MAAEATDEMLVRELLVAPGGRELHAEVVIKVQEKARPDDTGEDAPDRDLLAAALTAMLNLLSHDYRVALSLAMALMMRHRDSAR